MRHVIGLLSLAFLISGTDYLIVHENINGDD